MRTASWRVTRKRGPYLRQPDDSGATTDARTSRQNSHRGSTHSHPRPEKERAFSGRCAHAGGELTPGREAPPSPESGSERLGEERSCTAAGVRMRVDTAGSTTQWCGSTTGKRHSGGVPRSACGSAASYTRWAGGRGCAYSAGAARGEAATPGGPSRSSGAAATGRCRDGRRTTAWACRTK